MSDRQTDRQTVSQSVSRTDRQTGRQADRQTYIHTYILTYIYTQIPLPLYQPICACMCRYIRQHINIRIAHIREDFVQPLLIVAGWVVSFCLLSPAFSRFPTSGPLPHVPLYTCMVNASYMLLLMVLFASMCNIEACMHTI